MSQITIVNHLKAVKKVIKDTGQIFPSQDTVAGYLAAFRHQDYSYSHIRNTTGSLRQYLNFWGTDLRVKLPKKPEKLFKEILTVQEIRKLLAVCDNLQVRALIMFLACTGIRTKELKKLRVKDLDFKNLTVRIIEGKNFCDREICMLAECAEVLQRYIKKYHKTAEQLVFTDASGRQFLPDSFRRIFKQIKLKSALNKPVHIYIFRHSLATNMLLAGADILTIQKQLGHKDIRTTLGYISHTTEIFKKQYRKYTPNYLKS